MAKSVVDNLWDGRMGTQIPDFIRERLWDIGSAISQCQPFNDLEAEANQWMLEVALRESEAIIELTVVIRRILESRRPQDREDDEKRLRDLFRSSRKETD